MISVIICHHTGSLIHDCIESVRQSTIKDYEIIAVTSVYPMPDFGADKVLWSKALPAEKRNFGVKEAKGDYFCFLDDDVTIKPNALAEMLKTLGNDYWEGMVFGKLYNMEHKDRLDDAGSYLTWTGFLWSRAGQLEIDSGQWDKTENILSGKSAMCMIKREAFEKVRGFDSAFGILGEETDLAWRLWQAGYYVSYNPQAQGLHAFNTSFKDKEKHYSPERIYLLGSRNYIYMLRKNLPRSWKWWMLPLHTAIWLVCMLGFFLQGETYEARLIWRGVRGGWKEIVLHQQTSKKIMCHIFRSPKFSYYLVRLRQYLKGSLHG